MRVKIQATIEVEDFIEIDDMYQAAVVDFDEWMDMDQDKRDELSYLEEEAASIAYRHFCKEYGDRVDRHSVGVYTEDGEAIYKE